MPSSPPFSPARVPVSLTCALIAEFFSQRRFDDQRFEFPGQNFGIVKRDIITSKPVGHNVAVVGIIGCDYGTSPAIDSGYADLSFGVNMLQIDTIANHVINRSRTAGPILACAQAGFGKKAGTQVTLNVVSMTQVPT